MDLLKKIGRKIQVGIEKIDGPDPYITCHKCNQMMYNATQKQSNWRCDYCLQKFDWPDKYFRLRCNNDDSNVCRECAKNIEQAPQVLKEYPSYCQVCNVQLVDATRLNTDWTCHGCKLNYKKTDTSLRFRCFNHSYDKCGNCVKTETQAYQNKQRMQQQQGNYQNQQQFNQPHNQFQGNQQFNLPPGYQNHQGQFNQPPQSYYNQPPQTYNQYNQPPQQQQNQFNQPPQQNQYNQPPVQQNNDAYQQYLNSQQNQQQNQNNPNQNQYQQGQQTNYQYPNLD